MRLGAVLLAYCLLIGFGMARAQRLAVPSATRSRAKAAALLGDVEERLAAVEHIRANGAGEHAVRRFHQAAAAFYRAEFRSERIGAVLLAGTWMAFAAGTALLLAPAAWTRVSGSLTVGTAVLLFQYTQMVRTPFERLIDQLRRTRRRWPASRGWEACWPSTARCPTRGRPRTAARGRPTGG